MRDIFGPTLLLSDGFQNSCLRCYFGSQDGLIEAIRDFMQGVDLERWPELTIICSQLISTSAALDWRNALFQWERTGANGGLRGEEHIVKWLKEWKGEPVFQPSSAMNAFAALHTLIRANLAFAKRYQREVATILTEESE
jgi:hypothetical protein